MRQSKRLLAFVLILCVFSSCLAGTLRLAADHVSKREPLDHRCANYSRGIGRANPMEDWPAGLFIGTAITAITADLGILYLLAKANPWYAFGYLVIGYPLAASERFGPIPIGGWCGSPENPVSGSPDYFYYTMPRGNDPEPCLIDKATQESILISMLPRPRNFKDSDQLQALIKQRGIEFSTYLNADSGYSCVISLKVPGGEAALKQMQVPAP
ncbi:MAG: hypothetical protein JNM27_06620 [Leptospirales bacterium]|nr:hypothetical protein [Leptospirales bacterium]